MAAQKVAPSTIDEYIAQSPRKVQPVLRKLRVVIKEAAPEATERISYAMPGFHLNGMLVWFAPHDDYIGFYPTGEGIEAFKKELAAYKGTKGSAHFPLDEPMPYELIRKIVKYRVAQNLKKSKPRSRKY
jgi:uncharacterized protein YdhG (YjbR/CyaY superfamily)